MEHNINNLIKIDGSKGEGGGQIIRTALALSVLTGRGFKAENIRKGRDKPGLKNQHMYCIKALKELCNAKVDGDNVGSEELLFLPGDLGAKTLMIDIGTAGSISLLLQAVLLPAMFAERDMRIKIIGGTDVQWSMPIDYFINLFLPHVQKYAKIDVNFERRGYYPKGQGKVDIKIKQTYRKVDFSDVKNMLDFMWEDKKKIMLLDRGELGLIKGVSHASSDLELQQVATRQARAAKVALSKLQCPVNIETQYVNSDSTGSGIVLWANFLTYDKGRELDLNNPVKLGSDELGEKGVRAEIVGEKAAKALIDEINSNA